MVRLRFRHFSEYSFYQIALEQGVITFDAEEIESKSLLVDLVQTLINVIQVRVGQSNYASRR